MRSFFSHVLLLGVFSETCLGKCYYPNGGEASLDRPCDPDAEVSVCCGVASINGYACLTNKLCQSSEGKIIRGACTDASWESPDCPQFCQNVGNKGHDMVSCSNVTNSDMSYCCDGVENCCDSAVGRMDIQPPNAGIWAVWNSASDAYVVRAPLTTTVSSTSSSTSTTSTTEEAETSTTSTTSTNGSSTPTDTASGQSPDDQSDQSDQSTDRDNQSGQSTNGGDEASTESTGGLSTGAQAGIGVGAAAGAILLAALAFLWWKYNRLQAQTAAAAAGGAGQYQGPYYPPPPVHSSYYPQDPELAAAEKRQELYGTGPRFEAAELPGQNGVSPTLYADSPVMGR